MTTRSTYEMSPFQTAAAYSAPHPATGTLARLRGGFDGAFVLFARWRRRAAERRALRQLDDHLLRDIGLDRPRLEEMAARPFWRA